MFPYLQLGVEPVYNDHLKVVPIRLIAFIQPVYSGDFLKVPSVAVIYRFHHISNYSNSGAPSVGPKVPWFLEMHCTLLTVECLTVPLWYKQQVTFVNPKLD